MIIFVRGVTARLQGGETFSVARTCEKGGMWRGSSPKLIKVNSPFVRAVLTTILGGMKGNVNWDPTIEGDRREVLVEERFKHDHLVSLLQERDENRVLSCIDVS